MCATDHPCADTPYLICNYTPGKHLTQGWSCDCLPGMTPTLPDGCNPVNQICTPTACTIL